MLRSQHPNRKNLLRFRDGRCQRRAANAPTRLIDAYNATGSPGKYILRVDSNGQISVIGTQVRDETGVLPEISLGLDTPIVTEGKAALTPPIASLAHCFHWGLASPFRHHS
jgi:hypothetical protein